MLALIKTPGLGSPKAPAGQGPTYKMGPDPKRATPAELKNQPLKQGPDPNKATPAHLKGSATPTGPLASLSAKEHNNAVVAIRMKNGQRTPMTFSNTPKAGRSKAGGGAAGSHARATSFQNKPTQDAKATGKGKGATRYKKGSGKGPGQTYDLKAPPIDWDSKGKPIHPLLVPGGPAVIKAGPGDKIVSRNKRGDYDNNTVSQATAR